MTFLHLQLALAGIACVGIPILIHLLMRRRRKPVMWGAMRFLVEAYRKHKRRLLIEKWLLLATRCLLVLLLGLAIGRPLLGAIIGGGAGRTVYVLLDNAIISGLTGPDGVDALDRHKKAAREVLATLQGVGGEGDRAALVALGGPAEGIVLPVSADVPAVASLLEGVRTTDSRTDLPGALALVAAAIESDRAAGANARRGQTFVIILSDLLEGSADLTTSLAKLPEGVKLLASTPAPPAAVASNIAITDVEPLRSVVVTGTTPGAAASAGDGVGVTIRRGGPGLGQAAAASVVLRMAGVRDRGDEAVLTEVARAPVQWAAGNDTATTSLQAVRRSALAPGAAATGTLTEILEVSIEGATVAENAVPGDDTWRRPVEVRDALRVGIVAPRRFGPRDRVDRLDAAEWLRLALRPGDDSPMEVAELDPSLLDGARLAGLDAVLLPRPDLLTAEHWPRLRLFLDNGGLLMVMPPSELQVHLWSDALVTELGLGWRIAREATVYGGQEGEQAGGGAPMTIAPVPPGAAERRDLLAHINNEIDDLAKPVSVWKALAVDVEPNEGRVLLSLQDGVPLVVAHGYAGATASAPTPVTPSSRDEAGDASPASAATPASDRGLIVYLAVAPDLGWTDLPAKPLMVPLVHEIVREGIGRAHGSWWSIAGGRPAMPSRSAELRPIELQSSAMASNPDRSNDAGASTIVSIDDSGITSVPLRRAGLWRAVDERGGPRGVVAVNPDTRGGRTTALEPAAIEEWLGRAAADSKVTWLDAADATEERPSAVSGESVSSLAELLARESPGWPISLPLLIGALGVAVFELWLARWASHAGVRTTGARRTRAAA